MATQLRRRAYQVLRGTLERDGPSRWINQGIVALILLNVLAFILETVPTIGGAYRGLFAAFETVSVAVFTLEYLARLWVVPEDPETPGAILGRLRWAITPLALVDLFAVLPFYLGSLLVLDLRVLRVLRLMRLLRILKLARYSKSLQAMGRVIRRKKHELVMTVVGCGVLLALAASLMWMAEHEAQPEAFGSIPQAIWWAVITLTTVGYGDVVPVTTAGRLIGAVIAIIGIGFIALPAGLLASGFVEELSEEQQAVEEAGETLPARCPHCGELIAGEEHA